MNQEQATDSLGEWQSKNRIHTQNTDCRRDNENCEIMSLFYALFIMSDRMTESYKDWIDQSRLVIPNHLIRHIRRTCKGFLIGGRRKISRRIGFVKIINMSVFSCLKTRKIQDIKLFIIIVIKTI